MKILLSLLTLVFLAKDCKNAHSAQKNEQPLNELTLTYVANTRGFYQYINISKDSISFSKDRALKDLTSKAYPKKYWNELTALLKDIDVTTLKTLEPPSKKFQFDGAPMATLQLNTKDQEVRTPIFDHGNPPEAIAEIVDKVLALKETVLQN